MVGLQALRLEHRRRVRVCRFLGARLEDPGPQPVDTVLRRAPLRRRTRRRDADGIAARLSRQGDRRHGGARQERAALSVSAVWDPARCARRHGGQLSGPVTPVAVLDREAFAGLWCAGRRSVRWLTEKSFRSSTLALTRPALPGLLTAQLKNF